LPIDNFLRLFHQTDGLPEPVSIWPDFSCCFPQC
jgi:hypothetical protein